MILGTIRDITIIPANTRDLKISLQAVVTKKKEVKCFSFFYYQIKIYWQWYFYFYFVVQVDIDLQLYSGDTQIAGYGSSNAGDAIFEYNVN